MRMLFIIVISIILLSNCNRVIIKITNEEVIKSLKNTIEENEDKLNSNEPISKINNNYDTKFDEVSKKLEKMDTTINDLSTTIKEIDNVLKSQSLRNDTTTRNDNNVDWMIVNYIENEDNSKIIAIDSLNLQIELNKKIKKEDYRKNYIKEYSRELVNRLNDRKDIPKDKRAEFVSENIKGFSKNIKGNEYSHYIYNNVPAYLGNLVSLNKETEILLGVSVGVDFFGIIDISSKEAGILEEERVIYHFKNDFLKTYFIVTFKDLLFLGKKQNCFFEPDIEIYSYKIGNFKSNVSIDRRKLLELYDNTNIIEKEKCDVIIIEAGQNLSDIVKQHYQKDDFNTCSKLAIFNGILSDINTIYSGRVLIVPKKIKFLIDATEKISKGNIGIE